MTLKHYFEGTSGICVVSSAGRSGKVTTAIYSAPRVMDDGTVAFLMRERLTYRNLLENPYAACMFIADGGRHQGVRLYLSKIGEDNDPSLIARLTRRHLTPEEDSSKGPKHIVIFRVEKVLPLIGDGPTDLTAR